MVPIPEHCLPRGTQSPNLSTNVGGDGMQMRSKAYLQMVSRLRALRVLVSSREAATQEASPLLVFVAVVLAMLLAMLEVDLHSIELQALGLTGGPFVPTDPAFVSP
jgi:hypothetical protein